MRWLVPQPALVIYAEDQRSLSTIAVPDGFRLSYIHSINLSPVDEEFIIDATGTIVLERMLFSQLSTGMPSGDEEGFTVEGGRFATRPSRHFSEIQLRVSPVAGHTLTVGTTTRPLTRWASIGGLLILRGAASPPVRLAHTR